MEQQPGIQRTFSFVKMDMEKKASDKKEPVWAKLERFVEIEGKQWDIALMQKALGKGDDKKEVEGYIAALKSWLTLHKSMKEQLIKSDFLISTRNIESIWKFLYIAQPFTYLCSHFFEDATIGDFDDVFSFLRTYKKFLPESYKERTDSELTVFGVTDIALQIDSRLEALRKALEKRPPSKKLKSRQQNMLEEYRHFLEKPGIARTFSFMQDSQEKPPSADAKNPGEKLIAFVSGAYKSEMKRMKEPAWFYIDSQEQQQGPYALSKMRNWCKEGYFNDDNLVRSEFEDHFTATKLRMPSFVFDGSDDSVVGLTAQADDWILVFLKLFLAPATVSIADEYVDCVLQWIEAYEKMMEQYKNEKVDVSIRSIRHVWNFLYICQIMIAIRHYFTPFSAVELKRFDEVFRFYRDHEDFTEAKYYEKNDQEPLEVFDVVNVRSFIDYVLGTLQHTHDAVKALPHPSWQIFVELYTKARYNLQQTLKSGKSVDVNEMAVTESHFAEVAQKVEEEEKKENPALVPFENVNYIKAPGVATEEQLINSVSILLGGDGFASTFTHSFLSALNASGVKFVCLDSVRNQVLSGEELDEQIAWEEEHAAESDIIVLNFADPTGNPVALMNYMLQQSTSKHIFVTCDKDYALHATVAKLCQKLEVEFYDNAEELTKALAELGEAILVQDQSVIESFKCGEEEPVQSGASFLKVSVFGVLSAALAFALAAQGMNPLKKFMKR